jgi:hypothetical protein
MPAAAPHKVEQWLLLLLLVAALVGQDILLPGYSAAWVCCCLGMQLPGGYDAAWVGKTFCCLGMMLPGWDKTFCCLGIWLPEWDKTFD